MKTAEEKRRLFNYRADEYKLIEWPPPDFKDYIPQADAAQGMYETHLRSGEEPLKAFRRVLHAWIGGINIPERFITEERLERILAKLESKGPLPEQEERQWN